jgi:hypothetical protein
VPTRKEPARTALGIMFGAAGLVIGWRNYYLNRSEFEASTQISRKTPVDPPGMLESPDAGSERKKKGQGAELAFRLWVEKSGLSHLYIEQSPFSVPANLQGKIKRPDYILGFPTIGSVAFDVKSKRVYNNLLIFDGWMRRISRTQCSRVAAIAWCMLGGSEPSTKYGSYP